MYDERIDSQRLWPEQQIEEEKGLRYRRNEYCGSFVVFFQMFKHIIFSLQ